MIKIRQAKKEDLDKLIELRLELLRNFPDSFLITLTEEEGKSREDWEKWLAGYLRGGHYNFWVAQEGERLVGMVGCKGVDYARAKHIGTLVYLGVLPDFQGEGVGEALVKEFLDWAKNKTGIRRLQLDVYADNPRAVAFYKKMGFLEEGYRKMYARKADGTYQDSIEMALIFPDKNLS